MGGALQEPLSQVLGQQTRGAGAEAPRSRVPESLPPWAVRTSLLCLLLRGLTSVVAKGTWEIQTWFHGQSVFFLYCGEASDSAGLLSL